MADSIEKDSKRAVAASQVDHRASQGWPQGCRYPPIALLHRDGRAAFAPTPACGVTRLDIRCVRAGGLVKHDLSTIVAVGFEAVRNRHAEPNDRDCRADAISSEERTA